MIIQVDIDTDDILKYTRKNQDEQIADSFIDKTSDEALVLEVVSRGLVDEAFAKMNPDDIQRIINYYMVE